MRNLSSVFLVFTPFSPQRLTSDTLPGTGFATWRETAGSGDGGDAESERESQTTDTHGSDWSRNGLLSSQTEAESLGVHIFLIMFYTDTHITVTLIFSTRGHRAPLSKKGVGSMARQLTSFGISKK